MSVPQSPQPAKLVVGLFTADRSLLQAVCAELVDFCGPIDMVSRWFRFDFTDYYAAEMGNAPLFRRILGFKSLVEQPELVDIKLQTNVIEPGYLLRERFVLATGKNYAHRIYIGRGIYADLTLIYRRGSYRRLEWTYPDYGSEQMLELLTNIRRKYIYDLKSSPQAVRAKVRPD